jgi:phage terminase small subunit
MSDRPLTPKEARFVEEYLVDLNGAAAAKRAGYAAASANRTAYELMDRPPVVAALEAAQQALSERTHITQDMVVQELAKIGFADMPNDGRNLAVKRAALVDVGKTLGMFKNESTLTGPNGGPVEVRIKFVRPGDAD